MLVIQLRMTGASTKMGSIAFVMFVDLLDVRGGQGNSELKALD